MFASYFAALSEAIFLKYWDYKRREVSNNDDSEYRVLISGKVKYVTISPRTYDRDTLSTPIEALPDLPKTQEWDIPKIARFEWEMPRIVREAVAYQLLAGSGLAPRFLSHFHEHGQIGLLAEKTEGHEASIDDLPVCKDAVQQFHKLGLLYGDVNKFNFIGHNGTVKLIDFENSWAHLNDCSAMQSKLYSLESQLLEKTGRGGGFMPM
ncbi:hypothetical protein MGYG_08053 [Nannizzia gypsea CBS 118893]|uniref:Alpha-galactosidase A n=1 Tax=Arthroderma gypseum (strain ATCC MYA-4604 / CBS 118893) TaxID=535722 RepID=E4V4X2_ARTGP|nr:hypothetical protein MGYG_08053 [Nannizzia gypsea CBS 118893]EFR05046.1 hypothetical protein MGYG_08053 [Nannizzia gypsea CBS 118893]